VARTHLRHAEPRHAQEPRLLARDVQHRLRRGQRQPQGSAFAAPAARDDDVDDASGVDAPEPERERDVSAALSATLPAPMTAFTNTDVAASTCGGAARICVELQRPGSALWAWWCEWE